MPDFSQRGDIPEWMDGPDVPFESFRDCLADLAKVNRLTLAYRPTLAFLDRLHKGGAWPQDRPLAILDVGSGYGDMLRVIARWAKARNLPVTLTGLDLNPWAERAAERVLGSADIQFVTQDLYAYRGGADVVLSSLFAHHLTNGELVRFIEWSEANARIGWFINDLQRHPFSYYGFALLARLMFWHPFVRHDGPVSIRRAFVSQDWQKLLAEAGARQAKIEPWLPFRLCVSRTRG
jgi:SAM-dependent methyltransferase